MTDIEKIRTALEIAENRMDTVAEAVIVADAKDALEKLERAQAALDALDRGEI